MSFSSLWKLSMLVRKTLVSSVTLLENNYPSFILSNKFMILRPLSQMMYMTSLVKITDSLMSVLVST
jgi:hypothetical protein